MNIVVLVFLCGVLVVTIIAAVRAYRERPKAPPRIDLSNNAYEKAIDRWLKDVERGKVSGPITFPSYGEWVGLETFEYYKKHGVWPGEPS